MTQLLCRVPGCGVPLYPGNRIGVCRAHNHAVGHCQCVQCTGIVPEYHIKTRQEMVAEGLLPGAGGIKRKTPSLPKVPWK